MQYFIKTPWWLKRFYSSYLWRVDTKEKVIYLTFDDGPHPVATTFVLDELRRYNAKATFFCIGKNVIANPDIYRRILDEGHKVGNHTHNHLNGWKTKSDVYLKDVAEAAQYIDSSLFRPPYGRIRRFQGKNINRAIKSRETRIVMWSVLSGDFDKAVSKEACLQNVTLNSKSGSIIVFHDSEKSFPKIEYVVPEVLKYFVERGYLFESL
ncbi:MAG: polysaccharide deacetylase family protein [Bacteroidia bacterium]|nr:polysaccharide deacetylase family protein [Bacteroidia bacterium]